ncbi:hypothetical protein EOS_08975 [Caballeronia mineralivorans PML1(12)]|uniref:Uncharacterized protein n=1 Tax=Caballeronia mineralivorans PML1(12) TaxID=908627 RepID=A0A0J1D197_9BURK|nr:hypothetical protein [Caballeronia mineralivorans]KLU26549.1 hypothetical protein EOS_08975 [Caballeronia mineralivorans PML1(12)]
MLNRFTLFCAVAAPVFSNATSAFSLPVLQALPSAHACYLQFGFSPNRGAMDLVIKLIDSTSRGQTIDIEAYEFTSKRMAVPYMH